MTAHNLSLQDVLHTERRRLTFQDAHEKSIERKGGINAEMELVAAQVDEKDFYEDFEAWRENTTEQQQDTWIAAYRGEK